MPFVTWDISVEYTFTLRNRALNKYFHHTFIHSGENFHLLNIEDRYHTTLKKIKFQTKYV